MALVAELQRRNVVRVGIAYAVIGWVVAQIAEFAFENFGAPEWVLKTFIVFLLLGLPLALFFAWAFEMTPEGVKREKDVDRSVSITHSTGRKLDFVIIAALVVAVGYFAWVRDTSNDVENIANSATSDVAVPDEGVPDIGPIRRTIAVLPFINMSSDQEQEWFSDGLTEEILNALARTPDLLVSARTSSFKFKGSGDDAPTIAAALGVAHILEGSVRRGGETMRITAQLIRASDGFHLWSQTYDRKPEDVIAVQEDIAIEIAIALETAMDPEALAKMVSSGTRSVPAYNAYLKGLAIGISTATSADPYEFNNARDAFELAIELDPEFALAYWKLANFWSVQLGSTYVISGTLDIPDEKIRAQFDRTIHKAIELQVDPVRVLKYRSLLEYEDMQYAQALRLNRDYLEQRPNDQDAQLNQILLLGNVSMDDELIATVKEFQKRDGYNVFVVNASMTATLTSDDMEFVREFAQEGMRRLGDQAFVQYQAHRALLWAGDIDGASQVARVLASTDMTIESKLLVALRQACAENNLNGAARAYDALRADFSDDASMMWISNNIMNQLDEATAALIGLDNAEGLGSLTDYLNYAYFDARQFPYLMTHLESQGITPRQPKDIPYRCNL